MRVQRVGGVSQPLTLGPNETVSGLSGREQIRGFDVHFQPAHERLEEQRTPAATSVFETWLRAEVSTRLTLHSVTESH